MAHMLVEKLKEMYSLTLSLPESNLESINVVVTFKSVDKTLVCDHSYESYSAVLSCGTVYYAVQGGANVYVCG